MTEALRQAIESCGMSLNALAHAAGLDYAALWRFKNGRQSLRLDMADRLAEVLGIRVMPAKVPRVRGTKRGQGTK